MAGNNFPRDDRDRTATRLPTPLVRLLTRNLLDDKFSDLAHQMCRQFFAEYAMVMVRYVGLDTTIKACSARTIEVLKKLAAEPDHDDLDGCTASSRVFSK